MGRTILGKIEAIKGAQQNAEASESGLNELLDGEPIKLELLPCPFCGSEAVMNHLKTIYADAYMVTCCGEKNGDCPALAMNGFMETEEDAANCWNTRAD